VTRRNREPTPELLAEFAHIEDDDAAWEEYLTRPNSHFGWNLAIVMAVIGAIAVFMLLIVNDTA
jgi:hypothetical protein